MMGFLAAENENRQPEDMPQADFGRVPERFLLSVRTNSYLRIFILKIRPIVCFSSASTHVFVLTAPTHLTIFIRGLPDLLFSVILK